MNRGTLRDLVLSRRNWHADVDDDFEAEVNALINSAVKQLASDCPEAFSPDQETVHVLDDKTSDDLSRTLAATVDPHVLSFGAVGTATNIVTDGTWDGLYHVEVTTSDGATTFRRQCREFFTATISGTLCYCVSIDRAWRNNTDTAMTFRLHQPYFYLRDNVTQLVDGRIFDSTRQPLNILPAGWARETGWEDYQGQGKSRPESLARWDYFQIPAPNRAPTAALEDSLNPPDWVGPEPMGTFKYRYTYVWGRKSFEVAAPSGTYDPVWESAPSPESNAFSVSDVAAAIEVSNLVNIDHQLGFALAGALRDGRSGLRKRIYRARTAVTAGGGFETDIEYPGIYFLLDEVDGLTTEYVDDGSRIPDYHRRLPESRGYYAWSTVPHQDRTYEIDLRVYRRPLSLLCDSDAPALQPEFDDMLEDLVLSRICEMDKSPQDAANYKASYQQRLEQYRAAKANPADFIPPRPWRPDHTYSDPYRYLPFRSTSS